MRGTHLVAVALSVALGCAADMDMAPRGADGSQARASLETLSGCFTVRYHFVEDGQKDFFLDGNIEYMDVTPRGDGYHARNFLILPDQTSFLHWTQTWTPVGADVWTMRVEDGAGELRYQADGVWRFNQWVSEPALAAKPTRDAQRTDYDVLERKNTLQFTPGRWVHAQSNLKLLQDGTAVASEVGWITYTRLESDDACAPAMSATRRDPAHLARAPLP